MDENYQLRSEDIRRVIDQEDISSVSDDCKAHSEDGSILRKYISQLKHIRIHCIEPVDFCKEVIPAKVLSYEEISEICASKDEKPLIEGFSEITDKRLQLKPQELMISINTTLIYDKTSFTITPVQDIYLLPFEFMANTAQSSSSTDYRCECIVDVTHMSSSTNSPLNPKITARFKKQVKYGEIFKVSLPASCKRLSTKNSYKITIAFDPPQAHYLINQHTYSCTSFSLQSHTAASYYMFPFKSLKYFTSL